MKIKSKPPSAHSLKRIKTSNNLLLRLTQANKHTQQTELERHLSFIQLELPSILQLFKKGENYLVHIVFSNKQNILMLLLVLSLTTVTHFYMVFQNT